MKYLLLALAAIAIALPSCKKAGDKTMYAASATIEGPNYAMTACGGEYRIMLHGITDSEARFDSVPAGCGIDLSTAKFPINVSINWHHGTSFCDTEANIIIVDALEKLN